MAAIFLFSRSISIDPLLIRCGTAVTQELQQLSVDFLCVGPNDAMRAALHKVQAGAFDELGGALAGAFVRYDPVIVTVYHEGWNINARQVLAKILVPGRNTSRARDC
jgi:hypothetical protein